VLDLRTVMLRRLYFSGSAMISVLFGFRARQFRFQIIKV